MKKPSFNKNSLLAAVAVAGVVSAPFATAASHPFSNTELASGYNFDHPKDHKAGGEGKCGEGTKACKEGKCGEGDCGAKCNNDGTKKDKGDIIKDDPAKEGQEKNGAAKDGAAKGGHGKSSAEGKCGEGKCGEGMMKP